MPETPEIIAAIERQRAAILAREANQLDTWLEQWEIMQQRLERELRETVAAIDKLRATGKVISRHRLLQVERYQSLIAQTTVLLKEFSGFAAGSINQVRLEMIAAGQVDALKTLQAMSVATSFNVLPTQAVNQIIAATSGGPLKELLEKAVPHGVIKMTDELINAVALGQAPAVTARRMAAALGTSFHRMARIARTEQLRAYREATRRTYADSGEVVGFRRLATKDRRTCPGCLFADGEYYPIEEVLREHPQGRCQMVPVLYEEEPLNWERGPDWFKRQPEEVQRSILGPGRLALWQKENMPLTAFVGLTRSAEWGNSIVARPLKQMKDWRANAAGARLMGPPGGPVPRPAGKAAATLPKAAPAPKVKAPAAPKPPKAPKPKTPEQLLKDALATYKKAGDVEGAGMMVRRYLLENTDYQDHLDTYDQKTSQWRKAYQYWRDLIDDGADRSDIRDAERETDIAQKAATKARKDMARYRRSQIGRLLKNTRGAGTQTLNLKGRPYDPMMPMGDEAQIRRFHDDIQRYLPDEWVKALNRNGGLRVTVQPGVRAHYDPRGNGVVLAEFDKDSTLLHELMHALEVWRPSVKVLEEKFYNRRTVGENEQPLTNHHAGYRPGEKSRFDKFLHPYMGKDYGGRFYELLSMGVQNVVFGDKDDLDDIETDRDMMEWILGMMFTQ